MGIGQPLNVYVNQWGACMAADSKEAQKSGNSDKAQGAKQVPEHPIVNRLRLNLIGMRKGGPMSAIDRNNKGDKLSRLLERRWQEFNENTQQLEYPRDFDESVITGKMHAFLDAQRNDVFTQIKKVLSQNNDSSLQKHNINTFSVALRVKAEEIFFDEGIFLDDGQLCEDCLKAFEYEAFDQNGSAIVISGEDGIKELFSDITIPHGEPSDSHMEKFKYCLLNSYISGCLHYFLRTLEEGLINSDAELESEVHIGSKVKSELQIPSKKQTRYSAVIAVWKDPDNADLKHCLGPLLNPNSSSRPASACDDEPCLSLKSDYPKGVKARRLTNSSAPNLGEYSADGSLKIGEVKRQKLLLNDTTENTSTVDQKENRDGNAELLEARAGDGVSVSQDKPNASENKVSFKKKRNENRRSKIPPPSESVQASEVTAEEKDAKDDKKITKSTASHVAEVNPNVGGPKFWIASIKQNLQNLTQDHGVAINNYEMTLSFLDVLSRSIHEDLSKEQLLKIERGLELLLSEHESIYKEDANIQKHLLVLANIENLRKLREKIEKKLSTLDGLEKFADRLQRSDPDILAERQEAIRNRIDKLKGPLKDLTAEERKRLPLQLCHDALWLEDKEDNFKALFFDIAINNLEASRYATKELKATQEYQYLQNLKKLKDRISKSAIPPDVDLYQTLRKFDIVVQKADFSEEDKEKAYEVASSQINKVLAPNEPIEIDFDDTCEDLSRQIQVDERVSNIVVGAGGGVAGTATGVGCILWGVAGIVASFTSVFATVGISTPIALFGIGWSIASIVTGVGILIGVAAAEKVIINKHKKVNKIQEEWNQVCQALKEKVNEAVRPQARVGAFDEMPGDGKSGSSSSGPSREPSNVRKLQQISMDEIKSSEINLDAKVYIERGRAYLEKTMVESISRSSSIALARVFLSPGMSIEEFPLELQMEAKKDFVDLYNKAVDFYTDSQNLQEFTTDEEYIRALCMRKKEEKQPTPEALKQRHQDLFEKIYRYIFDEQGNYTEIFTGTFSLSGENIRLDDYLSRYNLSKEDLFLRYVELYQNAVSTFSQKCRTDQNGGQFKLLFLQFHTEFFGREQATNPNSQACRAFFREKCELIEAKKRAEQKEGYADPKMKEAEEIVITPENPPEQSQKALAKSDRSSSPSSVKDNTEVCHVALGRKYLETVIQNYEPGSNKNSKRLFTDPGMPIAGFSAKLRKKAQLDCERIYSAALCSCGEPKSSVERTPLQELLGELSAHLEELFEEIYRYIFDEKGGYTGVFNGKFSSDQLSVDEFLKRCGQDRAFLFEQYVLLYHHVVGKQLEQRFVNFKEEIADLGKDRDMVGLEFCQIHAHFFGVDQNDLNKKACQIFFQKKRFAQISQPGYLSSQDLIELFELRKEIDTWSNLSIFERATLVANIRSEILAKIDKISSEEDEARYLNYIENFSEPYNQWQRQRKEKEGVSDLDSELESAVPVVQKLENKGSSRSSELEDSSSSSSDSDSEPSTSPVQGSRVPAPPIPPDPAKLGSLRGVAELLSSETAFVGNCGAKLTNEKRMDNFENSQNEALALKR